MGVPLGQVAVQHSLSLPPWPNQAMQALQILAHLSTTQAQTHQALEDEGFCLSHSWHVLKEGKTIGISEASIDTSSERSTISSKAFFVYSFPILEFDTLDLTPCYPHFLWRG